MNAITGSLDENVLCKACQFADEHGTTLEALRARHLPLLAERAIAGADLRRQ